MRTVLAEARKAAGLNQRELSARLKRFSTFIAKIECGERRVDVVEFIQIARAVGIDPAELLRKITR